MSPIASPAHHALVRDGPHPRPPRCGPTFRHSEPDPNAIVPSAGTAVHRDDDGAGSLHDRRSCAGWSATRLGTSCLGHAFYRRMLADPHPSSPPDLLVPIGSSASAIIWGLEEWFPQVELSCDRAGLLPPDVDAGRVPDEAAGGSQLSELNPGRVPRAGARLDAVPDLRDSVPSRWPRRATPTRSPVVRYAES